MSETQRQIEENRRLVKEELDRQAAQRQADEQAAAERHNAEEWRN